MEYLDIESFRSKYSDITVTAVPAGEPQSDDPLGASGRVRPKPSRVEIVPITVSVTPVDKQDCQITKMQQPQMQEQQQQNVLKQIEQQQQIQRQQHQQLPPNQSQDSSSYSNEYQEVLAKLEYTKYLQAQLQLMYDNNDLNAGAIGDQVTSFENSGLTNIVEAYDNLLAVIAEMRSNLYPTIVGLRAPKERLLCEIAQARVLVRTCINMLIRDQQQEQACEK